MPTTPAPPEGFVIATEIPAPPAGFVFESEAHVPRIPPAPDAPRTGFLDLLVDEVGGGLEQMGTGGPMDVVNQPLGALRIAGAPVTAAAKAVGHRTLEATGSPVAAGLLDALTQVVGGAAVGKGARMLERGAKRLAPRLPGGGAGLREEGIAEVRKLPGSVLPATPSAQLYDRVDQLGSVPITITKLKKAAKDIGDEQAMRLVPTPLTKSLVKAARNKRTDVSFEEVRAMRQELGDRIGELRRTGGPDLGAAKRLYAALSDDLESAASGSTQAAMALKQANRAARREYASGELGDIVESGIRKAEGSDLPEAVNFAKMLNTIRKERRTNELFTKSFGKGELDAIESTLDELRKIPVPKAAKGASVGSALEYRRGGIGGFLGSSVGAYVGGAPGAVAGTAIGATGGVAVAGLIADALTTPTGRQLLARFVRSGDFFSPRNLSLLSAAVRATSAGRDEQ